jgi:hypothetical protein
MPSTAEMRAELKVMRESSADHVPVSRMKKVDISTALERLRLKTETVPAIAQMKAEKPAKMSKTVSMIESESDTEKPMVVKGKKAVVAKEAKEKAPAVAKESMKERMDRIRAMKKK